MTVTANHHTHPPIPPVPFVSVLQNAAEEGQRVEVIVVDPELWKKHCERVEGLVTLLESMMRAMADSPFVAMLPPDLVKQMKGV